MENEPLQRPVRFGYSLQICRICRCFHFCSALHFWMDLCRSPVLWKTFEIRVSSLELPTCNVLCTLALIWGLFGWLQWTESGSNSILSKVKSRCEESAETSVLRNAIPCITVLLRQGPMIKTMPAASRSLMMVSSSFRSFHGLKQHASMFLEELAKAVAVSKVGTSLYPVALVANLWTHLELIPNLCLALHWYSHRALGLENYQLTSPAASSTLWVKNI